MMISTEHKILACAGQPEPDENSLQKIRGYMSTVSDTNHLIDLAVKEGLTGFLYKSLLKAGLLETLNPHHKQRLYTAYYLTIRHNLKLIHALNVILKPLIQKQVQVVLMQGISLLQQVYRDIGLRPMKDMDIWVLPNQYDGLADSLIRQGFERNSIYPGTFSKGEVVLDIHTHIFWGDRIKSRDMLINLGQEEIFNNARIINAEKTAAMCLSPSDQFLYLSMHALKHNLERLIWLVDIKNLVAGWALSDWQALRVRAEELGLKAVLFYMLFVLTNIFKFKLPAEISSYLDGWKPNLFERVVLNRRVNGRPIPTWCQLVLISAGKGIRERISFVKETLFPRPKILRQVFPNASNSSNRQLYWKRFIQILGSFKF
jgi:hypothetical protein